MKNPSKISNFLCRTRSLSNIDWLCWFFSPKQKRKCIFFKSQKSFFPGKTQVWYKKGKNYYCSYTKINQYFLLTKVRLQDNIFTSYFFAFKAFQSVFKVSYLGFEWIWRIILLFKNLFEIFFVTTIFITNFWKASPEDED